MEIAGTDQGGLGLPDRDYYLKTDEKSVELRKQYVAHVTKMFELMGEAPAKAAADAKTVMKVETELAKASMDRVERRDPNKVYHKMTTAQLQELSPAFTWNEYFAALKAPRSPASNVAVPDFVKGMNQLITDNEPRRHQDVSALADIAQRCARAARRLRGRELQLLRQDADWGEGTASALEALRAVHRRRSGRGAGPGVRGRRRSRRQAKQRTLKMVHELEAALKTRHHRAFLDDAGDQEAGAGQAGAHRQQDRLSRQVARLQHAEHRARRCAGQFAARQRIRVQPPARTRSASRWTAASGA